MVLATSVMGVTTMENAVPRAGLEPTSLALQASVLPLHYIGSLMSPLYLCLHVYAAPCLRGQCRLLHFQHLTSYQDGYRLVIMHTYGAFIELPHWEIRLPAP